MENPNEAVAWELLCLTPLLYDVMFQTRKVTLLGMIPPTQLQALMALSLKAPINMTQLAARLRISKQQLTRVVEALVERKLVRREESPQNRRMTLIEMTGDGREFLRKLMAHKVRELAQEVQLTEEERATLMAAAEIIKKHLADTLDRKEELPCSIG